MTSTRTLALVTTLTVFIPALGGCLAPDEPGLFHSITVRVENQGPRSLRTEISVSKPAREPEQVSSVGQWYFTAAPRQATDNSFNDLSQVFSVRAVWLQDTWIRKELGESAIDVSSETCPTTDHATLTFTVDASTGFAVKSVNIACKP